MNKLVTLFILSFILSTTACVKDYDPGFDEHVPKLVLNSVFSTDSVFIVNLSTSRSITENTDLNTIEGAKVELFENGQKIEELQASSYQDTSYIYTQFGEELEITTYTTYLSSIRPTPGKSYSIEASKEGFENVYAESQTPTNLTDVVITADLTPTVGAYEEVYLRGNIYVDIDDVAGEKNFYEFQLFLTQEDSIFEYNFENDTIYYTGEVSTSRYKLYANVSDGSGSGSFDDEFELSPKPSQFSDVTFDGTTKRFVLNDVYLYNLEGFATAAYVELELRSVSEDYYNYFTSYEKQSYNQGNFLAEPVIVYNNIENGYGVFAGYSTTVFPIDLE